MGVNYFQWEDNWFWQFAGQTRRYNQAHKLLSKWKGFIWKSSLYSEFKYKIAAFFPHLVYYFRSDDSHRTLFRESRTAWPLAVQNTFLLLPSIHNHEIRDVAGTFMPIPFSICSWICCPWFPCPGGCGDRHQKELNKFKERKQVLQRDRSFHLSWAVYLYLALSRVARGRNLAADGDLPRPGTGRAGTGISNQQKLGSLTKLCRLGGVSLHVKNSALQRAEFPQGSAEMSLAVLPSPLPSSRLHLPGLTSSGMVSFGDSGELQGSESWSGDQDASAERCDQVKPYRITLSFSL